MNKEEIEEIETLEIDFKNTDELELALAVSANKAIYLIDDLIKHLLELQQENARLKDKINMAIEYYEANQQECVIGRNKDEKLIKEYYLPAQCSKKLLDILKESGE